jgi:thiamine biosynthesis protein ThiI
LASEQQPRDIMDWVVVHYQEIGVKGKNRILFERALIRQLQAALRQTEAPEIRRFHGRILVDPPAGLTASQVDERLGAIPGIAHFAHARVAPLQLEPMAEVAVALARASESASFRIRTRRSNKRFLHTSVEVNQVLGRSVQQATGKRVDLGAAELTIFVEIIEREALLYTERLPGLGGLPVGTAGKLVCLLSGGIDSPVAAFKMIRRGARVVLLHFHNYTRYQERVRSKLLDLARLLNRYQLGTRLYIVPFGEIQSALVAAIPPPARMVAYRRAMLRVGALVLEREGAKAFVTGDSLGQVASQTLDNLQVIYQASGVPVLAPLIGEDKQSIVDLARRIGSYEISIRPYEDCCSFLVPRRPDTRVKERMLSAREAPILLDKLAPQAVEDAELYDFPPDPEGHAVARGEAAEACARTRGEHRA